MNYMKLFCKKNFCLGKTEFEIGELYEYYSTFGGLNHFVIDKNNSLYPFCGPVDDENKDIEEFIEKDDIFSKFLYIIKNTTNTEINERISQLYLFLQ